jgi:hypothetical protein
MTRVEKKDLLKYRLLGFLPQDQGAAAWMKWVVGLIRRVTPWGGRVFLIPDYL